MVVPPDPTGVRAVRPDRARPPYYVAVIGTALFDRFVCLQYAVSPVPAALRDDGSLHEGDNAGIAIDSRHHIYRHCRSAYRRSRDGSRVVGVLEIGPSAWPTLGAVRILFAPLAHTAGLDRNLCELRVTFEASRMRTTVVR